MDGTSLVRVLPEYLLVDSLGLRQAISLVMFDRKFQCLLDSQYLLLFSQ